jgi:hypothetical protein
MPASGPTALPPTYTVQTPALTLSAAGHDQQHEDNRAEDRAIWTKMGLGASTPTANTVLRGTGAGTSAFGKVVAADISAEVWTAFTPTLTQGSGVAVTVNYATYLIQGKVAHVQLMLSATATGTAATAIGVTAIPAAIAPRHTGASRSIGSALFVDGSMHYTVSVVPYGPAEFRMIGYGTSNYMGADPNITLASGDTMAMSLTYEIA